MHHRPLNAHSPSHALCVNTASPRVATTVGMCVLLWRAAQRLWSLVLLLYPALNFILCSSFTNTHIGQYRHPANRSPRCHGSHPIACTVCDLEAFWRETTPETHTCAGTYGSGLRMPVWKRSARAIIKRGEQLPMAAEPVGVEVWSPGGDSVALWEIR